MDTFWKRKRKKKKEIRNKNDRLIKDRIIRDIMTLFEKGDYYKPKRLSNFCNSNYMKVMTKTKTYH